MAKPIETFHTLIKRAENMISLYEWLQKRTFGPEKAKLEDEKIHDLLRSSLVISVSAFDSYFTDKFVEKAPGYLKKHTPSDDLIELLNRAGVDLKTALELLRTDRPLRRIRTYIERYLERYVTQEFSRIDNLYKSFGIKNLTKNAAQKTKIKTIATAIQGGITRRHKIVHGGDLNSHDKPVAITPDFVRRRINYMKKFIQACDEIIDSSIK